MQITIVFDYSLYTVYNEYIKGKLNTTYFVWPLAIGTLAIKLYGDNKVQTLFIMTIICGR